MAVVPITHLDRRGPFPQHLCSPLPGAPRLTPAQEGSCSLMKLHFAPRPRAPFAHSGFNLRPRAQRRIGLLLSVLVVFSLLVGPLAHLPAAVPVVQAQSGGDDGLLPPAA